MNPSVSRKISKSTFQVTLPSATKFETLTLIGEKDSVKQKRVNLLRIKYKMQGCRSELQRITKFDFGTGNIKIKKKCYFDVILSFLGRFLSL